MEIQLPPPRKGAKEPLPTFQPTFIWHGHPSQLLLSTCSVVCLGLAFCVFFWFSFDYFVLLLFAFVVLDLVSSVLFQEIGWEEETFLK